MCYNFEDIQVAAFGDLEMTSFPKFMVESLEYEVLLGTFEMMRSSSISEDLRLRSH